MADQLAANPLVIDIGASNTARTIWKHKIHILNIEFVLYSSATDTFQLSDQAGNNLWDARGSTDFSTIRSGNIGIVNGIALVSATVATTGLVKIYFK